MLLPLPQRRLLFSAMYEHEKGFNLHLDERKPSHVQPHPNILKILTTRHHLLRYVDDNPGIVTLTPSGLDYIEAVRAEYEAWKESLSSTLAKIAPDKYEPRAGDVVMWTEMKVMHIGVVRELLGIQMSVQSSFGKIHVVFHSSVIYLGSILYEFPRTEMDNPSVSVLGDFLGRVVEVNGTLYHDRIENRHSEAYSAQYGDRLTLFKIQVEIDRLILHLYEKMVQS